MANKEDAIVPLSVAVAKQKRINNQRKNALGAGKYDVVNSEQLKEQQKMEKLSPEQVKQLQADKGKIVKEQQIVKK